MKAAETSYFDASRDRLVRRPGEPHNEHGRGRVKAPNDLARAGLPLPDVVGAVREAWLSADGLGWQSWSTVEETPIETPEVGDRLGGKKVALYDVEPFGAESPERRGKARLTLEAASALGSSRRRRIFWGLEGRMWHVFSTEMEGNEKPVQGRFS
jgi:hypothetical protein